MSKQQIFQQWEQSKKTAADWVHMDDLLDILEETEKEHDHVNA